MVCAVICAVTPDHTQPGAGGGQGCQEATFLSCGARKVAFLATCASRTHPAHARGVREGDRLTYSPGAPSSPIRIPRRRASQNSCSVFPSRMLINAAPCAAPENAPTTAAALISSSSPG